MKLLLEIEYDDTLVGAQYIADRQFEVEGVESVEIKEVSGCWCDDNQTCDAHIDAGVMD